MAAGEASRTSVVYVCIDVQTSPERPALSVAEPGPLSSAHKMSCGLEQARGLSQWQGEKESEGLESASWLVLHPPPTHTCQQTFLYDVLGLKVPATTI